MSQYNPIQTIKQHLMAEKGEGEPKVETAWDKGGKRFSRCVGQSPLHRHHLDRL
jgi:hypothetical protein